MAKSLVIVESPAKARTIKKYLGPDYTVKASVGHVKDLPKRRLGIDMARNFKPEYVTIQGKKQVLQELRSEAKKAAVLAMSAVSARRPRGMLSMALAIICWR